NLLVVAVAVTLSGILARRVTHEEVRRLLIGRPPPLEAAIEPRVASFRMHGGWRDAQEAIDAVARATGEDALLTTPQGDLVARSTGLREAVIHVVATGRVELSRMEGPRRALLRMKAQPWPVRD